MGIITYIFTASFTSHLHDPQYINILPGAMNMINACGPQSMPRRGPSGVSSCVAGARAVASAARLSVRHRRGLGEARTGVKPGQSLRRLPQAASLSYSSTTTHFGFQDVLAADKAASSAASSSRSPQNMMS